MDAIGGQEFLCPVLTPVELWQATGRDKIPEIFHLTDRDGRHYILPLTHEETFTFHAREIRSYKELPQLWYHFQTKDRDEPRPRGGLLRVREFIMKDAYSFDRDQESSEASFERNREAYHRIFDRCGVEAHAVQAESGIMGGELTIDFLAPSGSGENVLVRCERGDYAADAEIARGVPRAVRVPARLEQARGGRDARRDDLRGARRVPRDRPRGDVEGDAGHDRGRAGRARARPRRRPPQRVEAALRPDRRARGRRPTTRSAPAFGASGGSLGPVGFEGEVVADETLRDGQFVAGANRDGFHLRGVEAGRDYEPRFADIREPLEGDRCPNCGGALTFQTAIEVGHIFNFGDKYSSGLDATFLDEDGKEKPLIGGSYGIGPGRIIAAVIEQNHDEHGIAAWPQLDRAVRRARRRPARARGARPRRWPRRWRRGEPPCSWTTATCGQVRSSPTPT